MTGGLLGAGTIILFFVGLLYLIAPLSIMFRLGKLNSQADLIIREMKAANQALAGLAGQRLGQKSAPAGNGK